MEESMVIGWLSWGDKRIPLEGRLLSMLWELGEMQKEINQTDQGQIILDWKHDDIKTSIKKVKQRRKMLTGE